MFHQMAAFQGQVFTICKHRWLSAFRALFAPGLPNLDRGSSKLQFRHTPRTNMATRREITSGSEFGRLFFPEKSTPDCFIDGMIRSVGEGIEPPGGVLAPQGERLRPAFVGLGAGFNQQPFEP